MKKVSCAHAKNEATQMVGESWAVTEMSSSKKNPSVEHVNGRLQRGDLRP